ncbi:MAG: phosphoglycolate phosphatase [Burkholderiaceae bacterium]
MPFSAVLFDLDGTLLDTIADIADATNAMLVDLKKSPVSEAIIRSYVGKGTENLIARVLSDHHDGIGCKPDEIERGMVLFSRHYGRLNGNKTILYPGALKGLKDFKKQGAKLAIVTNKSTEFTPPLLARMGIDHFFEHVICGDTCTERKPHPMSMLHACELLQVKPANTLAIGDSINDARAAQAAKIKVLAVPYGYNEGVDVRTLEVDDIVTSIEAAAQWAAQH